VNIEEKRKLRTAIMRWVFEVTGGSQRELAHPSEFTVPDGWTGEQPSEDDIGDAVKWLEGERLLKAHWSLGGLPSVQLTHPGIREMEQALAAPEKQTEHFVPLVNITTIHGDVIGSQLQQGSPGASQTGTFQINQRDNAEAFITAARKVLDESADLSPGVRVQVEGDLTVMTGELAKPSPRWGILAEFGKAVRDSLIGAGGAAAAGVLLGLPWP
jgi:hypothetical protein